ncbi:PREDICTED: putative sodium-coupled neutral amino acid transporter 10 [Vollenhovia emeryi]|uniref:putative sodium-coupled neutral amino acid transporter 10 n=1 Tax=Vollenhovia emeryi TaxID=411798 RepID=UPI0005F42A9A|nr:PREDICTED: putative sodium-coupled neutral amino acid transporter 10 [Vollenhovia emeryi]XP_011882425.1 PREDICTED: putative sodium-coupled neutral amino acid transporter 10 [Vollenhovia emeryi]XP_011882426.1 PREDICTED: putative sodium-coupled neutral amino acid transporter 10 [Vollenhovia emeryi]
MIAQMSHVMTLANSIIGVSVLAMPFCFKQCGIVLAVLLLLLCSALSRLACHFLVKSAVISRRRNFELLAFHAFGHMGKFLAELFIIGFMLGTCIAYYVVVGDLGPQIISKMMSKSPADIRTSLLIFTGVFIVLPLGLLRNIDSLSSICTATIVFYLCLVLKIMGESTLHIFMGDWVNSVNYWRPAGILQCLPIFSMALFCQTQLFEIYETIPNVSLEKMNDVVRGALNICTLVYMCVGLFGYIAFCTQSFTGNILLSFEPSITSELIKLGFVFSVAFSFPLVIFPCRASLNSLLFRRVYTHEPSVNYLPESRFRCLTIAIVGISLVIGILVPNIEFVLGIVGSTIGVMICVIFPTVFFISISSKNTNEKLVAQGILIVGVWIMILGTYANLYAIEESTNVKLAVTNKPLIQINNLPLNIIKDDLHIIPNIPNSLELIPRAKDKINQLPEISILDKPLDLKVKDVRQEPPVPVERIVVSEKPNLDKSDKIAVGSLVPEIKNVVEPIKNDDLNAQSQVVTNINVKVDESVTLKAEEKIKIIEQKEQSMDLQKNDNLINLDAIKKEESELAADGDIANARAAERHEQLRKTLEKHKLEQRQMMQEQKEILKDIKEQKQEFEREKQRMAKDETLKKNEMVQTDVKENVLPEIKGNVGENDKKPVESNEIIIAKSNKDVPKEKELSDADKIKLDEKPQLREENSNVNIAVEDSEKKLDPFHEIPQNKNAEDLQKISENAPDKIPLVKEAAIDEAPEKSLQKDTQDETKVERIEFSDTKNMKGPILNVLSKGILQRSVMEEELARENDRQAKEEKREILTNEVANTSDKLQGKYDNKYSVPIALKMTNQSKLDKVKVPSLNKSEQEVLVIRRDILENNEREKRDVDGEMNANVTKVNSDRPLEQSKSLVNDADDADTETCSKLRESSKKADAEIESETEVTKPSTTEVPLINTNIYLSGQRITKTISMDQHAALDSEYAGVNQEDSKVLSPKDKTEI